MTAMAATIGMGNIAGVATAVTIGGGAIFWMWITALFGMATKYAEAILAVKYRVSNENGEYSGEYNVLFRTWFRKEMACCFIRHIRYNCFFRYR